MLTAPATQVVTKTPAPNRLPNTFEYVYISNTFKDIGSRLCCDDDDAVLLSDEIEQLDAEEHTDVENCDDDDVDDDDDDDDDVEEVDDKDQLRTTLPNAGQSRENIRGAIAKRHYCHPGNVLWQPGQHSDLKYKINLTKFGILNLDKKSHYCHLSNVKKRKLFLEANLSVFDMISMAGQK